MLVGLRATAAALPRPARARQGDVMNGPAQSSLIGGVYEIGVGVTDLDRAVAFWAAWGYRPGPTGHLAPADAQRLYGVPSGLRSIRLQHQSAVHGLVRLFKWTDPIGPGLGFAPLRSTGSRWSVHKTDDIMNVFNHAETARLQGQAIRLRGPMFNVRSPARGYEQRPFEQPIRASHNFEMLFPEARLVAMQRFHVDMTRYGTIADGSVLRASEGCHMGLVVTGEDFSLFDFYRDALGFKFGKRVVIDREPGYTPSDFFDLTPGESFTECDLEDPASGATPATQLPGRLRVFMIHHARPQPDLRPVARPGHLGYCLYTCRGRDAAAARAAVAAHAGHGGASQITPLMPNEFGEPGFSFTAPDGYAWAIVQAP
jgi:catechol 2,3-dioxygenase-like lactoylglutathione lyase family enzyme